MRRGKNSTHYSRAGFTVLELVIFSALFSLAAVSFITVLVAVTRIQVRQTGAAEVNQQSQFLLQTLQHYIESSSLIEMSADTTTSTLKLRMPLSASDPTYVYLSAEKIYLKETDAGTPQLLTSDKVRVSSLNFVRRANPAGRDSISLSFSMEYNAANPQQRFLKSLMTSVARVSAATFDSNVVPSTSNTYKLGASAADWQSINNTIFFNGSNVGIGASSPNAKLQITSGDLYIDTVGKGVLLRSPDGTCWRVMVSNAGAMSNASTTCP